MMWVIIVPEIDQLLARVIIALDTELDLLIPGALLELAVLTIDTLHTALASSAHKFFRIHIPFAGGLRQLFGLIGNQHRTSHAVQAAICVVSESHALTPSCGFAAVRFSPGSY
jgi:hypothetical protein